MNVKNDYDGFEVFLMSKKMLILLLVILAIGCNSPAVDETIEGEDTAVTTNIDAVSQETVDET